jgi:hypothetical protein
MNECEAAIAPFHSRGTGIEFEVFDEPNDVVVLHGHCAIMTDRRAIVLVWASRDPDSKCRSLILKSINDNSSRLDSTVAMTQHRSSASAPTAKRCTASRQVGANKRTVQPSPRMPERLHRQRRIKTYFEPCYSHSLFLYNWSRRRLPQLLITGFSEHRDEGVR